MSEETKAAAELTNGQRVKHKTYPVSGRIVAIAHYGDGPSMAQVTLDGCQYPIVAMVAEYPLTELTPEAP